MTATLSQTKPIVLNSEETATFKSLRIPDEAGISIHDRDGNEVALPKQVQETVMTALHSLIENGEVAITRMPEKLSSTSAAELLGVSRPTLLKWAKEGRINSFKVGTHTRFNRDDVLALKRSMEKNRNDAFEELRAFELENFGPFSD